MPLLLLIIQTLALVETGLGCEIRVRVPENNAYAPFYMQDDSGRWSGLSIDLAQALLDEAGCTPVYVPLPFSRGIYSLKTGGIDVMLNLSITEERRSFLTFIGPQLDDTVLFVTRKDTPFPIVSLDDLKKLPAAVGIERGKLYGVEFERLRQSDPDFRNKLEEVNEIDLNARKLALGRISGFISYSYNVTHLLRTNPLYRDFRIHPFIVSRDWVYVGVSKKAVPPGLENRIRDAYDRATAKGSFEAIRKKYVMGPD
ncbi:transporter substrate-binding domain-containing protein [Desulfoprunum benzoelyticum]|nr:transporter substrate-binding domain-containing protein [Desulfoprunum benzoelyticum]MBM9530200.1 transporter substrate-binding domain-containing protein [Desulfoprunum benzoelyticum]